MQKVILTLSHSPTTSFPRFVQCHSPAQEPTMYVAYMLNMIKVRRNLFHINPTSITTRGGINKPHSFESSRL